MIEYSTHIFCKKIFLQESISTDSCVIRKKCRKEKVETIREKCCWRKVLLSVHFEDSQSWYVQVTLQKAELIQGKTSESIVISCV